MRYRVFKRTWWAKDGKPRAGRKIYTGHTNMSLDEARRCCARCNLEAFGSETGRGARGMAYDFESY